MIGKTVRKAVAKRKAAVKKPAGGKRIPGPVKRTGTKTPKRAAVKRPVAGRRKQTGRTRLR